MPTLLIGERTEGAGQRRVTNDAVMVADVAFTKALKALDKELEVVWNWVTSRWEIWRFYTDGRTPRMMLKVETEDKKFRELGADILLKLQAGDPTRFSLKELVAYFDKLDEIERETKRRDLMNKIHAISCECADTLRGVLKVAVPRGYLINEGRSPMRRVGAGDLLRA